MCNDSVQVNNNEFEQEPKDILDELDTRRQTGVLLDQIKSRSTAPEQLRIAQFNKKFTNVCPSVVLPKIKRDLLSGNAALESGMLVTLIAEVINPDNSDGTFQFNVIDPDDASIKECVDTYIGINYISEDSPNLDSIHKLRLCERIVKAQKHLAGLEAELATMLGDMP